MPRSQEPGESDDASEPKLVLAGVRSKSTKRLMNLGFEITARVVEDEASGVVVKDYPEVTLRVIKDDKYTYEMLQLNVQTGFGVLDEERDEPYTDKGWVITNVQRKVVGKVLRLFMTNPLYDPSLACEEYAVRCRPIEDDESLALALDGLPWSPSERRRRVGRRLEQTLAVALDDLEKNDDDNEVEDTPTDVTPATAAAAPEPAPAPVPPAAEASSDAPDDAAPVPEPAAPAPAARQPGGGGGGKVARAALAAHGLFELSVERRHHADFSDDMLAAVVRGLSCRAWEVALYSAGTVWQLSRSTRQRRALVDLGVLSKLQALIRRSIHAPGDTSGGGGGGGGGIPHEMRMKIQDFCAGCMGVFMVDVHARRSLFSEYPDVCDLVALSGDNPAGDVAGLEAAAVVVNASSTERVDAMAKLLPIDKTSSTTQIAASEALLSSLCRDPEARRTFAESNGLGSIMGLLESRVPRVQFAASNTVALYSMDSQDRQSLAMSGDASEVFTSLVQSMEVSVLGLHEEAWEKSQRLQQQQLGSSTSKKISGGGSGGGSSSSAQLLKSMIGAQGAGIWACAMATHTDDSVAMDSETSQRMIFLAAVSLEVSGIVRAQTCLAGVFACLALDPEEAERIMSFVHDPERVSAAHRMSFIHDPERIAATTRRGGENGGGEDTTLDALTRYVQFPRPTGKPTAQGWKLNRMLIGGEVLHTSEMGPRRALSSMLRYLPHDDEVGSVWVRAHAAAAVGNLASHPTDARGEDSLRGTFRRKLMESGMFEDILSAASHSSGDAAADEKCVEASTVCLMLLAGEGHVPTRKTMTFLLDFIEKHAGDVRSQQFLMVTLWLMLRDPKNRDMALSIMMPADEEEAAAKAKARAEARAAAREARAKAKAARAEAAKRAEEAGGMPPPPEDGEGEGEEDDKEEEGEEGEGGGFEPAPGRQRLLAVLTLVAERNIDRFVEAGLDAGASEARGKEGTDFDSQKEREQQQREEMEAEDGGKNETNEDSAAVTDDGDDGDKDDAAGAEDAAPGVFGAPDEPMKEWVFTRQDSGVDPAVMTFTWWIGTLWLFMYDPQRDRLLGPREDVFEFKEGTGWWTVPPHDLGEDDDPHHHRPNEPDGENGSASSPPPAKPELSGAALGMLVCLAEPRRRCHQKVQELAIGLMWNLAARDAVMQHRMVTAAVPELCGRICGDTSMTPPLREKALGLLQCLFEGSSLAPGSVPRLRVLMIDAAVAMMDRGDEWAWKDRETGMVAGGPTELNDGYDGAGDDPFALELAALTALTRVTAELDAKELCAERGVLDHVVAVLSADYHGPRGISKGTAINQAEGDIPVPPPRISECLPATMRRSNAVREAAIVNLRNLSSCRTLMAPIAKRALYLLVNLNLDRRLRRVVRVHAAAVLQNIHKDPANRTRFYKAELRYKSLGTYRKGRSQDPPRAPKTNPLPRSATSDIHGSGGEFSSLSAGTAQLSSSFSALWGGASGYGSEGYGSDGYGSGGGSDGEGGDGNGNGNDEGVWREVPAVLEPGAPKLKDANRPHTQMSGHMLHWINQQFPPNQPRRLEGWQRLTVPVDPYKIPTRLRRQEDRPGSPDLGRTLTGTESSSQHGFLPNISGESSGMLGYSRGGGGGGGDERKPKHKFTGSMCRPVNKIWGVVPGEGAGVPGTGGLRKGNLRWGPVVQEYVTTDAKCYLTPGSDELLTARRPGSTARRLNEAAELVAAAAAADHLGISGGHIPRPSTAMPDRPTRPWQPMVVPGLAASVSASSRKFQSVPDETLRRLGPTPGEQPPPLTIIVDGDPGRRSARSRGATKGTAGRAARTAAGGGGGGVGNTPGAGAGAGAGAGKSVAASTLRQASTARGGLRVSTAVPGSRSSSRGGAGGRLSTPGGEPSAASHVSSAGGSEAASAAQRPTIEMPSFTKNIGKRVSRGCLGRSDGDGFRACEEKDRPKRSGSGGRGAGTGTGTGSGRDDRNNGSKRRLSGAATGRRPSTTTGSARGGGGGGAIEREGSSRVFEERFLESFNKKHASASSGSGSSRKFNGAGAGPMDGGIGDHAAAAAAGENAGVVGFAADWNWGGENVGDGQVDDDGDEEAPASSSLAAAAAGEENRRMALQVVLEQRGSSRHRISFEDKPEISFKVKAGKALRFMAWKKVEGSKVHDDLPSYQLPNGMLGHFYDRGSEYIDEATAPAATPPDQPFTLKGLLQSDLPPRTILIELSTPKEDGELASVRPNPRLPPDPECHTLDVSQPPRFFGDLRQHLPMVEAKVELVHQTEKYEERHKVEDRPPWDINASVFAPRRRESDGKDYYNNVKVQNKQFESDWKRVTSKERFVGFVEREAKKAAAKDGKPAPEPESAMKELKDCLKKNFRTLARCFIYYSLLGTGDVFSMQLNEYSDFIDSCNIPDPESEGCKRSHCDTLFITANYEDKADNKNDNNALMRFEFLEVIVRLAVMKFGGGQAETWDISDNITRLINNLILPSMPPMAVQDEDEYRRKRLYCEDMDLLYEKKLELIKAVYSRYRLPPREGGVRAKMINLDDWMALFEDIHLIDEYFTMRDLKCCFCFARMTAVDEYNIRKNEQLTLVDFLDALGRVAELVNLPIQREIEWLGHANVLKYHEAVRIGGEEDRAPRRESAEFEKPKTRRLSYKTEMLLELMFRRLDLDKNASTADKAAEGQDTHVFDERRLLKRLRAIDKNLGP